MPCKCVNLLQQATARAGKAAVRSAVAAAVRSLAAAAAAAGQQWLARRGTELSAVTRAKTMQ